MEFLESLNSYITNHPVILENLELALRIKHYLLLGLAIYFVLLPYREYKKQLLKQKEQAKNDDNFLA